MRLLKLAAAALLCSGGPALGATLEIATAPRDSVVQIPANSRGYVDFIIHTIGVRSGDGVVRIDQLQVELLRAGKVVLTEVLPATQLIRDTQGLMEAPVPQFITGQLLDTRGLDGFFGKPSTAGASATLAEGQALLTSRRYYAVSGPVDQVRIVATGASGDGTIVRSEQIVPIAMRKQAIEYRSPLKGIWLMQAIPTLQSHHRFNPPTEFAVDFMKLGENGGLLKGDPALAESYFGFGEPVLAVADGIVTEVLDGERQDRTARTRQPNESTEAAQARMSKYNIAEYQRDFRRAAAGNLVILRHEAGGTVEYSSYGHLKAGVAVKVGDRVRVGQIIGHVGDTGDSATVHLHFQLNSASDPFHSTSLPVRFSGLRPAGGNPELGRIVIME